MQAKSICVVACAVGVGALAMSALSRGGPLNPPAGPVAPTGVTLGEIGASVNQIASASAAQSPALPVLPANFMGAIEFVPPVGVAPITGDQTIGPFVNAIGVSAVHGADRVLTGGTLGDVSIVKLIDKASPKLQDAICNGTNFPEVRIDLLRAGAAGASEHYFVITLTNARVSSYSIGAAAMGGDGVPTETISMNYEKIKWTYTPTGETSAVNSDGTCAPPTP